MQDDGPLEKVKRLKNLLLDQRHTTQIDATLVALHSSGTIDSKTNLRLMFPYHIDENCWYTLKGDSTGLKGPQNMAFMNKLGVISRGQLKKMKNQHGNLVNKLGQSVLRYEKKIANARPTEIKDYENRMGDELKRQLPGQHELNLNLANGAALDPVSLCGTGFGNGLARDPFIQTSTLAVLAAGGLSVTSVSGSAWMTKLWYVKGAVSVDIQYAVGGLESVDVFDMITDSFTVPGLSTVAGDVVDIIPFNRNNKFQIAGYNKPFSHFASDVVFGYVGAKFGNQLSGVASQYLKSEYKVIVYSTSDFSTSLTFQTFNTQFKKILE